MLRGPSEEQGSIFHGCLALMLCHMGEQRAPVLRATESPAHCRVPWRVLLLWLHMVAVNPSVSSLSSPSVHLSHDSGRCAEPPVCLQHRGEQGPGEPPLAGVHLQ